MNNLLGNDSQGLFTLFLRNALRSKSLLAEVPAAAKVLTLGKAGNKGDSFFFDRNPKGTCPQSRHLLLCFLRRHPVCASSHASIGGFVSLFAPSKIG